MDKNKKEIIMIDTFKRAIKTKTLLPKVACFMLQKVNLSNDRLQALQVRFKNYEYLKKKYGNKLESYEYICKKSNQINKNIWICWLQGENEAPLLVKKCIQSVRKYMSEFDIHIITAENMQNYIQFPDYIMKKWQSGIIPNTFLSDLLRTELMIQYGGLWLDATVLLTSKVPAYIYENDLFMYTHSYPDDVTINHNNWLIYSTGDNRLLKVTRDLLYAYWKEENTVREYFVWHLFMSMAAEKYPEDVNCINYITDELPETLARIIFYPFDQFFWNELINLTPIHKLSNKLNVPKDIKNTYYDAIINM